MNGRKARGLRNEAAHYAKTFDTVYQNKAHKVFDIKGKVKVTRSLIDGCHRAVYQQLKR